ncbi:unnamed protein product [Thlaspi arvense]|uniref:GATA-type domain-containing protein n=1 Tax=Thlaspi arvense TaxID=13288 RepID=A0AAU9RKC5_THLAR|nr:unnamed protein product [Thlaspi arvense]
MSRQLRLKSLNSSQNQKRRMLDHSEEVNDLLFSISVSLHCSPDSGDDLVMVDSETMKRRGGDMIEQNKSSSNDKKTCVDCGTSKTPLWRGGPAGPKSLCNACGIRKSKKRRGVDDKKPKKSNSGGGDLKRNPKFGESLKQRIMDLGMTKRSTVEKQRRKLGEEEQAAVLLMALSYGSVYA